MTAKQNIQIIFLRIIRKLDFGKEEWEQINKSCLEATGNEPVQVVSFEHLRHVMEQYQNKEFVIFSNFARSSQMHQVFPDKRDSYEYTAIQFQNICMDFMVNEIHIITEAEKFVVQMELVDLLTRIPPLITYQNSREFLRSGAPMDRVRYIVEKINKIKKS
jgi:hypothetical protein